MANKQFNSVDGYSVGNANIVIDSNGNVSGNAITATANVTAPRFISNVATGTSPFVVTSTTRVSNLNADLLGGLTTDTAGSNSTIVARTGNGQVVGNTLLSSIATGTAPLVVTSTTRVANLNVAYANVADNINVAAGTGNNFLIFANAATGNVAELTSTGLTANLSNNSITATTFVGSLSGTATSATTAGTVTTNAQPNITSVGTLTSLAITSGAATKLTVTANAAPTADMVIITNAGQGTVTAGVSGMQLTFVGGAAAVEASAYRTDLTPGGTTGGTWNGFRMVAASGAASGVTMNAIKIDNITGGAGTENMILAGTGWDNILNYNGTSVIYGNGTINGAQVVGTVPTAGTVTTNAQPNITSVGSLSSLNVTGNANVGNLGSSGNITAANITANTGIFTGNGSGLSAIAGANVTGTVANATFATSAGTAGTVTTAAQPNITSVGTLSSLTVSGTATAGNLTTAGTLTVTGNTALSGANVSLGAVGNIRITGGTANQFLRSEGASGAVSWQTLPVTSIQEFTATGGQTTFTVSGTYIVGSVLVFVNGIQMNNVDYTATNGTTVVLTEARVAGDTVRVISSVGSVGLNNIQNLSVAMSVALGM